MCFFGLKYKKEITMHTVHHYPVSILTKSLCVARVYDECMQHIEDIGSVHNSRV